MLGSKLSSAFCFVLLFFSSSIEFTLDKSKRFIIDNKGRYSIFHGVNVVVKLPPYFPIRDKFDPQMSLCDEDIKIMKQMGFNIVRLGVIWEAVEISEGVYDFEFLNKTKELVDELGKNGIYTMLDAHQDCITRKVCGEGMPSFYLDKIGYTDKCDSSAWAYILGLISVCKPMSSFNMRYDEKGLPLIEDCTKQSFVQYHFTPEMTSTYKSFYDNKYDIQEKFTNFWKTVANYFKGDEYVVGYDLWNEPFPGGLFDTPLHWIYPSNADMEQIMPVYRKVDKSLREIDPNYILFFENMPFPDFLPLFGGLIIGKFTERVNKDENANQVYNVHNYCCLSGPTVCSGPEPDLETAKNSCPDYHKKKLKKNLQDASELNVPLIVSEFGACSDSEACYHEVAGFVKEAEPNFISWMYWNYKPYGDFTTSAIALVKKEGIFQEDGSIQEVKERSLTRAYVQYYQGKPLFFKADENKHGFETEFVFDKSIEGPNVIYLNREKFFKRGSKVEVLCNDEEVECDIKEEKESNYITIEGINESYDGKAIKIILTGL